MRINEVKSQFSLVKGERKACQEVISALCPAAGHAREYIGECSEFGVISTYGSKIETESKREARTAYGKMVNDPLLPSWLGILPNYRI